MVLHKICEFFAKMMTFTFVRLTYINVSQLLMKASDPVAKDFKALINRLPLPELNYLLVNNLSQEQVKRLLLKLDVETKEDILLIYRE